MSTVSQATMTAEEFFLWVQQPTNRGRRFELCHGEVIEMPPPGKYHGFVCGNVARILGNYAIASGRGYVCTNDAGVIVGTNPDSVRGPDVTFYIDDETAEDMERQYATDPPLLAVEVVSPSDRINDVMSRVGQLLSRGVEAVWVIDPDSRDISICRRGTEPQLLSGDDHIEGEASLPQFQCSVSEFFATPSKKSKTTQTDA